MAANFHLTMADPDGLVYESDVESLVVPASKGYLGVLAHHAPIVATLTPGTITLRDTSGKSSTFASKSGGILEVSGNSATILLDSYDRQ